MVQRLNASHLSNTNLWVNTVIGAAARARSQIQKKVFVVVSGDGAHPSFVSSEHSELRRRWTKGSARGAYIETHLTGEERSRFPSVGKWRPPSEGRGASWYPPAGSGIFFFFPLVTSAFF